MNPIRSPSPTVTPSTIQTSFGTTAIRNMTTNMAPPTTLPASSEPLLIPTLGHRGPPVLSCVARSTRLYGQDSVPFFTTPKSTFVLVVKVPPGGGVELHTT